MRSRICNSIKSCFGIPHPCPDAGDAEPAAPEPAPAEIEEPELVAVTEAERSVARDDSELKEEDAEEEPCENDEECDE